MDESEAGVELLYRAVLLDEAGLIYDAEPLYLRSVEQMVHGNRARGTMDPKSKAIVLKGLGRLKELRALMIPPPPPPEPPRATTDPATLTLEGERLFRAMEHKRMDLPPWNEEQARKAMGLDSAGQKPFFVDKLVFSQQVKQDFLESVVLPCRFPQLFAGSRSPRSTLFFGPPGVGKTVLLRQISAFTDGAPLYEVNLWNLTGRYVHDPEQLLGDIFQLAASDSRVLGKPAVIFLDELDAMRPENQSRWAANLASLMDQHRHWGSDPTNPSRYRLIVCAATNTPWRVESMVLRRFERRVYIPFPDDGIRKEILRVQLESEANAGRSEVDGEVRDSFVASDDLLDSLAFQTRGFTGSDLAVGCRAASMQRIRAIQRATHFRRIAATQSQAERIVACGPSEPDARPMTINDMTDEEAKLLWLPPMTEADVRSAFSTARSSMGQDSEYMKLMADFQREYT